MSDQEARDDEREALAEVVVYQTLMNATPYQEADAILSWLQANGYRKHPEPEIAEMVERAVRATWAPSEWLNADQNDERRDAYAADVRRILVAALRVPVGEGKNRVS